MFLLKFLLRLLVWILTLPFRTVGFSYDLLPRDTLFLPDFARPLHLRVGGEPDTGKTRFAAFICLSDVIRDIATLIIDGNGFLIQDLIALILKHPEKEKILSRFVYVSMISDRVHNLPWFDYHKGLSAFKNADTLIEAIFRMTSPEFEIVATTLRHFGMTSCIALYEAGRITGIPFQAVDTIRFLEDKGFRARILHVIKDTQPEIVSFYNGQYNQWGWKTQNDQTFSFKSKIYPFVYNDTLKAIVGANSVSIDFAEIEKRKLVLALDLSGIPDQEKFLIGTTVVNRFSGHVFSHSQRDHPISLVVDEAPSLLAYPGMARDFGEFQSRARAFKLWLTVIHQNMSQLEGKLRQALWSIGNQYIMRLLNIEDAEEAVKNLIEFIPEKAKVPEGTERPMGMAVIEQARFDANALQRAPNRYGIFRRPVKHWNWRKRGHETLWVTTWEKVPEISTEGVTEAQIEAVKRQSLQTFARPKSEVLREIEDRYEQAMKLPVSTPRSRKREKA